MNNRVIGIDLARGIAVWGMILMNFKIVMTQGDSGLLGKVTHLMEGHFGVMFVVLAGIGISLFMKSAIDSGDKKRIREKKILLLKRSGFLIVTGFLFSFIWQADILHYYGFYIAFGMLFIGLSSRWLIVISIFSSLIFTFLFLTIPYEAGWNWETLQYVDLFTTGGFLRHTFYNGFHPVFPWVAFLLFGIVIGRKEFEGRRLKRLFIVSFIVSVLAEVIAHYLVSVTPKPLSYIFSRDAMPPGPLFVIASSAEALFLITLSIYIAQFVKSYTLIKPLVLTGQMVLSHYIIHIFLGLGILELWGSLTGYSLEFSIIYSTIYFIGSVLFSWFWGANFKKGPMELVMRRIAG